MRPQLAIERRIAFVASNQHGVINHEQLVTAGVHPRAISHRVAAGRLHRLHRGVYAVGHRGLSHRGRWMAGVLACGPGAALSHRSAAEHWGMLTPGGGPVHITVPTAGGRARRPGLRLHRSTLLSAQTTSRANIPVTRPGRTLADLRRTESAETFRSALRQAEFDRLPLDGLELGEDGTGSELEAMLMRLLKRHRLPLPEPNARVGRFRVDCLWRSQRLIVELDGRRAHGGTQAFEDDRARDVQLTLMGYRVLRFTWRQVRDEPRWVAEVLATALRPDDGRPR